MTEAKKEGPAPLKRIDLETGRFTANGRDYFIEGSLSIARYAEFQIYEKELAYGLTVKGLYEKLKAVNKFLDKIRFVDAVVAINDVMRGVMKLEEREPVVLKICALYCNTTDEDRTVINEDMITQKIADWKAEGIDMRDFFLLASNSVNGLLEIYRIVTLNISGPEKENGAGSQ